MKTLLKLLLLLVATTVTAFGYTFEQVASAGWIQTSAWSSNQYYEVKIQVRNTTSYSFDVDFATVVFVQPDSSQRVGLTWRAGTSSSVVRITANAFVTLTFGGRCMDRSRPAPATGVYFSGGWRGISTEFQSIINALRSNASQSAIWNLTEYSGTSSTAWKAADPRNRQAPPPPPPPAQRLDLAGSWSWQSSGSSVNIRVGTVANYGSTTSGSLRLSVWTHRTAFTGGTINGTRLGVVTLGQLGANRQWTNVSQNTTYSRPSAGTWWTVLVLEEYTSSGWVARDYMTSSSSTRF